MANTYNNLKDLFTAIANAIRLKNGGTDSIVADTFPVEIENLKIGFDYVNSDVTEIPDCAFYGCEDLLSVDCYNLESIGVSAFENCTRLKSVILYDAIMNVGENAFKGCNNLNEIYVAWAEGERDGAPWGADNATIYYQSVGSVGLEYTLKADNTYEVKQGTCVNANVTIPKYHNDILVTSIGFRAFYNCEFLTSIIIPNSVTVIDSQAFLDCESLTFINIPDGIVSIGEQAFRNCASLESIDIPDSIASIDAFAFYNCPSLKYNEYDNAYYLGNENNHYVVLVKAKNIDITSCNIHNDTKIINSQAFYFKVIDGITQVCSLLTLVTIPATITSIGKEVFYKCRSLSSINYTGTIVQWQSITFGTNWNYNTPDYTIHCTDGDIAKDGTITYH